VEPGSESRSEITQILQAAKAGDSSAVNKLMPLVYDELRSLAGRFMSRERPGHTLQPTELVNEAFLRLVDQTRVDWQGRTHFFAVGARVMRRILVDHARSKLRKKRGERPQRVELTEKLTLTTDSLEDVLALDEALEKLNKVDPRQARIVEMRFFGGLTVSEVAEVLNVSKRTVEGEWTMVRAWLRRELSAPPPQD
jgi:RNA polymerase sigma factor (TIGR02999 family)